jgi:hypothetical protein
MKKRVSYRGVQYEYRAVDIAGKLQYLLYEGGIVVHIVPHDSLDKISIVDLALEKYYNTLGPHMRMAVLR